MDKDALYALAKQAIPGRTLRLVLNTTGPIMRLRPLIEMDSRVLAIPGQKRFELQSEVLNGNQRKTLELEVQVIGNVDPDRFAELHDILDAVEVLN